MKQSKVDYVKIQSTAGQVCRIVNPWSGGKVRVFSDKNFPTTVSGEIVKIPTQVGETLVLLPLP